MRFLGLFQAGQFMMLAPVILLCACVVQPGSDMSGGKRTEVSRDGVAYVVLQKGEVVEIQRRIRTNSRDFAAKRPDMILLMSEVTGCKLRESSLQGAGQMLRGIVIC